MHLSTVSLVSKNKSASVMFLWSWSNFLIRSFYLQSFRLETHFNALLTLLIDLTLDAYQRGFHVPYEETESLE